jgi:chloramphenicol O-acetyltransferase type A
MVIGTSAMIHTELDCIVNQYTDQFSNPMVMWGKYRQGLFKTTLPVSFQFHHVQMDGGHAAKFLQRLQDEINKTPLNFSGVQIIRAESASKVIDALDKTYKSKKGIKA